MFQGTITALVTPFDDEGHLDELGLRQNIQTQLRHNIDGLVPLGTTAETPTLTEVEKKRILEIVQEEVGEKVPVIVGTGDYSTQTTIENSLLAQEIGADAVLVVVPYYNKPTQKGIYEHFAALAEAIDLPIIIYNNPGRTGQAITPSTLLQLSSLPQIVGLKDCSGSILYTMEVIESICRHRSDFTLLSGDDGLIFPCMSAGGHGVISVLSNLIPGEIAELVNALRNSDYEKARSLHYQLQPLFRSACLESNPIPIKTAMNAMGMPAGKCRLPLCEMGNENKVRLLDSLSDLAHRYQVQG